MKPSKKLSLKEIEVKSFITNLETKESTTINGAKGEIALASAVVSATTAAPTGQTTVAVGITCAIKTYLDENETFTIGDNASKNVCGDSNNIYCNGIQTKDIAGCLALSMLGGQLACVSANVCY
ncbi:MAG: pinensin family lanthipeptide [Bacteroidetes bacterium]|nr:pinensin family lanthipeptide [Bacteroidota bacterium]